MKDGVSVSISREAWEYAWELKRLTRNRKSVGKIISEALLNGKAKQESDSL